MGKGKKKGAKGDGDAKKTETEPPSLAGLSIRDAPSTSEKKAEPAKEVEKKKTAAVEAQASTSQPLPSIAEPLAIPAASVASASHVEEQDDEGGLGLGGGKKRKPRKKKDKGEAPVTQAAVPPGPPSVQAVYPPAEGPAPPGWGQPKPATLPPPGYPAAPGPSIPPSMVQFPPQPPRGPEPTPGWGQAPQPAGMGRGSGWGAQQPSSYPGAQHLSQQPGAQQQSPQPFAQQQGPQPFAQQQGPQPAGMGRGSGWGAQQPSPYPGAQHLSQRPGAQQQSPQPFAQQQGPQPFAQQQGPQPAGMGRGSGWGAQQPSPYPGAQYLSQRPGAQQQSPQPFAQQHGPQPFAQQQGPRPVAQQQGPRPVAQQQGPRPVAQQQGPGPVRGQGDRREIKEPEGVLCRYKIPAKIEGRSVRAMPVKVLVNYLPMTIKPLKIFRYDVSFKPDRPKKMIPEAFKKSKSANFPKNISDFIAFDQSKNCYSLNPLPNVTQTDRFITNVELLDPNGKTMRFEVSYKGTGQVDLKTILDYMANGTSLCPPTEAIQCIDVILRQGTLQSYVKAGRQFFKRPSKPIDLGDGLEMWTGLFQSAIFTSRPFINIDVAHKGFPRAQKLIDAMRNEFRLDLSKPVEQQRGRGVEGLAHFIKGLRVLAMVGGDATSRGQKREFICNELVDTPRRIKFNMTTPDGKTKEMTVEEYFTREKKIRLQYPNTNCMWVGPRDKNIYYPVELLDIVPGQALNKQLNEMQLATMVKEAATPPSDRKAKIEEVIRDMNYSGNPYFKQFGLDIKTDFHPVNARVLQPPKLEMGGGQRVDPRRGVWQSNRLLKAETLEAWGFVAIETDHNSSNADQIINLLKSVGTRMGMRIADPKERFYNVRITDLQSVFYKAQQMGIKFLVVVVSGRGRDYYHRVKKMAEREVGILTQCIKEYTAQRRMNDSTARNILLKVNSKLMGINQALDNSSMPKCLADGEVMIVGADVTHPSPDQTSVPSIAAVTASIDPRFFNFNIQMSVQTPKKEMIVEFEEMMEEHLRVFKEKQRRLPKKIFIFRDGVSEGQFAQVLNSELTAVHNAYRRLAGPTAKPQVLLLLVQKRHHTRFFLGPTNPQNVEPGTVVDTDIVHARELDFYLVSHQAIKGTARPTRYHAVCNDGAIPHDEVEQLTYYLCHLYSRCTRSVSYPTPTYYAHLACLRARSLTYGEKFNNAELETKPRRLRVLDRILEASRMFFV